MKTFFCLLMLLGCLSVGTTYSQEIKAFNFAITGGANLSSFTNASTDYRVGFNAGLKADYYFNKAFFLTSGLYVTQKGGEKKDDYVKFEANPLYLQLPIYCGLTSANPEKDIKVSISAGPYIAVGVAGETLYSDNKDKTRTKSKFFDHCERMDAGVGASFTIQFKQIQFLIGYQYGLVKLHPDFNSHNSSFNAGLAFYL